MRHLMRVLGVVALSGLTTGCIHGFQTHHELPANAYFGHLPPAEGEKREAFDRSGRKNYALAGLVPYTSWGAGDLLEPGRDAERIEDLEVETVFDAFDEFVQFIPGLAYVYYVWAPRSVRVTGEEVRNGESAVGVSGP